MNEPRRPGHGVPEAMPSRLRVLVEQPTRGKRWVAVAADWPGLERGAKSEAEAIERLARYVPRYLPVAARVGLDAGLLAQSDTEVIGRYPGTGSTDFWGISFAPSPRTVLLAIAKPMWRSSARRRAVCCGRCRR